MSKYSQLLILIDNLLHENYNTHPEEIKKLAYEYYQEGYITTTQYDHIINTLEKV